MSRLAFTSKSLLLGVALLASTLAHAGPLLVVCPLGSTTTTYSPGINNTPRDISYTSTTELSLCVTALAPLFFTSAVADPVTRQREDFTCLELLRPFFTTDMTFHWGDGGASKVVLSTSRVEAEGAVTSLISVGSVTEGKYQGAIATRTLVYANLDLTQGCLTEEGLKQTQGTAMLVLALPQ
jgi:hypothetical protein